MSLGFQSLCLIQQLEASQFRAVIFNLPVSLFTQPPGTFGVVSGDIFGCQNWGRATSI